jgi:phage gpG-like protein
MDAKHLSSLIAKIKDDVMREVNDRLPRTVGITAVNLFRQNFRDAGYHDGTLKPWQKTRRQLGKGTDARYTPLTSRRNHLMRSTSFTTQPGQVTVENPVPYASIHNEGGDISTHPRITARLRRYAWHMVYSLAGVKGKGKLPKDLPKEAEMWKGIALTKKHTLNIRAHIPKRQFMGDSKDLNQKINLLINQSIERIKQSIAQLTAR